MQDVEFLKRYIHYCRTQCGPRLNEEAAKKLASFYVEIRGEARGQADAADSDAPPVPITVRQLEAVVRLSESLAKMALQVRGGAPTHTRQSSGTALPHRSNAATPSPGPHAHRPVPQRLLQHCNRSQQHATKEARHLTWPPHPLFRPQQPVATLDHVAMAIDLFTKSTMDAVKSGLTQLEVGGEAQLGHVRRLEERIKRRLHIGAQMTTR